MPFRSGAIGLALLLAALWPVSSAAQDDGEEPPVLEIGMRVHAGWQLEHLDVAPPNDQPQTTNEFLIRRAKLGLTARPMSWLRGELSINPAKVLEVGGSGLRDAAVDIRPLRQLRFRVGQFKKPFSGLELTSSGRLKVVERGDGNELLVEDLGYGDRDLGFQAYGRLVKSVRLEYAVGVFNGSGPNLGDRGPSKDFVGRLQLRPFEDLDLGVSGSYKAFDDVVEGQPEKGWAAGGDAKLRVLTLRLYAEALLGLDHVAWSQHPGDPAYESPMGFDVLAILSRRFELPVSWRFALEPAFKIEFLDPNADVVADDVLSFTPGLNSYFGESFRLMVNGEFRQPGRNAPKDFAGHKMLTVLGCLEL